MAIELAEDNTHSPTAISIDDQHAEFQHWVKTNFPDYEIQRWGDGYLHETLDMAWRAWLAGGT